MKIFYYAYNESQIDEAPLLDIQGLLTQKALAVWVAQLENLA